MPWLTDGRTNRRTDKWTDEQTADNTGGQYLSWAETQSWAKKCPDEHHHTVHMVSWIHITPGLGHYDILYLGLQIPADDFWCLMIVNFATRWTPSRFARCFLASSNFLAAHLIHPRHLWMTHYLLSFLVKALLPYAMTLFIPSCTLDNTALISHPSASILRINCSFRLAMQEWVPWPVLLSTFFLVRPPNEFHTLLIELGQWSGLLVVISDELLVGTKHFQSRMNITDILGIRPVLYHLYLVRISGYSCQSYNMT